MCRLLFYLKNNNNKNKYSTQAHLNNLKLLYFKEKKIINKLFKSPLKTPSK